MSSVTITLTFQWPMGHRILGLEGEGAKCRNIHGHNWTAEVELPNDDGELEFGEVKSAIGYFIETVWDHGFMVSLDDPFKDYLIANGLKFTAINEPPTTEAVAGHLADIVTRLIGRTPTRVHVLEGYRNAATWRSE